MKNIIIILSSILFYSCTQKEYKYRINNPNYLHYNRQAVFFTDTILWKSDTAYYKNSDKSIVIISIDILIDCKIDTLNK